MSRFGCLTLIKKIFHRLPVCLLVTLCFGAGCGTPFKYLPKHDQTYPAVARNLGLEISGGVDVRPEDEKLPVWSKSVEVIVARALADEMRHAGLFKRVKIHLKGPVAVKKFSYFVEFRVEKFEMVPSEGKAEQMGHRVLRVMGWRGALISASIPVTWISNVRVEFEIFDAVNKQPIFIKTYAEVRNIRVNGFQGKSRQIQETSDALNTVIEQFVGDFSRLAARPRAPGFR